MKSKLTTIGTISLMLGLIVSLSTSATHPPPATDMSDRTITVSTIIVRYAASADASRTAAPAETAPCGGGSRYPDAIHTLGSPGKQSADCELAANRYRHTRGLARTRSPTGEPNRCWWSRPVGDAAVSRGRTLLRRIRCQ